MFYSCELKDHSVYAPPQILLPPLQSSTEHAPVDAMGFEHTPVGAIAPLGPPKSQRFIRIPGAGMLRNPDTDQCLAARPPWTPAPSIVWTAPLPARPSHFTNEEIPHTALRHPTLVRHTASPHCQMGDDGALWGASAFVPSVLLPPRALVLFKTHFLETV